MKTFVLVALLAILSVAFGKDHCFDNEFQTRAITFDPSRRFDSIEEIWFSVPDQKERVDFHEFHPHIKRVSVWMDGSSHQMYVYDRSEGRCERRPFDRKIEQYCLQKDAEHTSQITLGGKLKADIYSEHNHGFHTRFVISSANDTPINIFSRGGSHHNLIFQEFWDWEHKISSKDVFNLPDACKQAQEVRGASELATYAESALRFVNRD